MGENILFLWSEVFGETDIDGKEYLHISCVCHFHFHFLSFYLSIESFLGAGAVLPGSRPSDIRKPQYARAREFTESVGNEI